MTREERGRGLLAVTVFLASTLDRFATLWNAGGPHRDVGGGSDSPLALALKAFILAAEAPWPAEGLKRDDPVRLADQWCRDLAREGSRILRRVLENEAEGKHTDGPGSMMEDFGEKLAQIRRLLATGDRPWIIGGRCELTLALGKSRGYTRFIEKQRDKHILELRELEGGLLAIRLTDSARHAEVAERLAQWRISRGA